MGRRSRASAGPRFVHPDTRARVFPALFLAALIGSAAFGALQAPAETTAAAPATAVPSESGPAEAEPDAAKPAAAQPVRLTIEAAGIDVTILPLTPTDAELATQSIIPPFTDDGYWLSSYGQPGRGSTNTTYLTGHSWEGRDAPFNRLSTQAAPGNLVTVETATGTLKYSVDSITTYNKDTLKDSEIWDVIPNQLVIISCHTEDLWGKNVVITASPA
ncbi:class F sortase [Arthrobacter flavus]|uniref:Class F sortase n=1 Tax=Arthrobacter flavus TaxID=95172 RepID=A0ABW4QBV6_9MICC